MNKKNQKRILLEDKSSNSIILIWPDISMSKNYSVDAKNLYQEIMNFYTESRINIFLICKDLENLKNEMSKNEILFNKIKNYECICNDIWVRDFSPIQVNTEITNEIELLTLNFNGYGSKYEFDCDARFSDFIIECHELSEGQVNVPLFEDKIFFEGGNLIYDSEICFINLSSVKKHNNQIHLDVKKLSEQFSEKIYQKLLLIDLPGINGDDTDGHIDNFLRIYKNNILFMGSDSNLHPDYSLLKELERQLILSLKKINKPYNLIKVNHSMDDIVYNENNILPFSYLNYIQVQGNFLIPIPKSPYVSDSLILTDIFKNENIKLLNPLPILKEFGGFHCCSHNWYI